MSKILIQSNLDADEVYDKLNDMEDRSDDFRPLFREVRRDLEEAWRDNFAKLGGGAGGWAPLDAQYGSWKSVHFPGAPPMIRTGRLFRSLSDLRGEPNEIRKNSATFGTNIKYASFHQTGTSKMPRRPVVFEPFDFARKWSEKAANFIERGTTTD